ncbi:bacterial regulatory s, tetR family protein [Janthinobacterium agaricidamnosum NBRC 102515 = DSM 9628]|uniref:Bacterial regulatory s, tetR family protein n=2 Tax=Janthinobacterium agaricidamnosum TaxID=55508 RepID=W0V6R6_9BURK|nr:bacterial regulatory s, tetR family protein [Janthinobacterium agaricidamnosum NBRC 102515 = DSM 9628]
MENTNTPSVQKKLLDATERLIYAGGICATGMDAIVKASGVARKTIYRYFGTKDGLVAEALRARDQRWMAWFIGESCRAAPGASRLLATFDVLTQWFATPDFRGCAFINAAGETADAADPIRLVAKQHKLALRGFLRQLATEYGAADPDALADALLILVDGAITVALVTGDTEAASKAQRIARSLLKPAPTLPH